MMWGVYANMPTNISTIHARSTIQKVWDALTQPEQVKKWQYGSDVITDWKPGSEVRFRTVWEGKVFEQWGKIQDVIPGKLIRYSLFAPNPGLDDLPENYFMMSYVLTPESEGVVKLEIIQEDNRPTSGHHEEGNDEENPVLLALKNLVEE
jgi:uncharacterized protein YndB with AHSA1/START domain